MKKVLFKNYAIKLYTEIDEGFNMGVSIYKGYHKT